MERKKLILALSKAVENMRSTHWNGTYYWHLGRDGNGNVWAIVLGWSDGYEEDETDDCTDGTRRLCVKLAYQPGNSMLQCCYDVDWLIPYDEKSGEVDDTEISIYPDTDLKETVDWLFGCYEIYKEKRRIA